MRTLLPLSMLPAAVLFAQSPLPVTLAEAQDRILEALDEGRPRPDLQVKARDEPGLRWLQGAQGPGIPVNPFARGSRSWKEAEALKRLETAPSLTRALKALPLALPGTRLALWCWGRDRVRRGALPRGARHLWEDRLLEPAGPAILREYALRHALCLALDDGDEARFMALKTAWEAGSSGMFLGFQRAFALRGGRMPLLRLWRVPSLQLADAVLPEAGEREIHIRPLEGKALPELPTGSIWIVPTERGDQPLPSLRLTGRNLEEAEVLSDRLQAASRTAYLAASRDPLESYGLVFFPVVIHLDARGQVERIRMGDAALVQAPAPASGAQAPRVSGTPPVTPIPPPAGSR